jgi:alanyl-tRNA synthetase
MTTERLYYGDPFTREFDARVIARRELDGRPLAALDRTAFYPTGGGQPHDTGELCPIGGQAVTVDEVIQEDGQIWHALGRPLEGEAVRGRINWDRRFDHMQQHTGQHILSQAFVRCCDAETVAFHMGAKASTIDLDRTDLSSRALAEAEAEANAVVDASLPVYASFVDEAELDSLPLRRPPPVSDGIRIVQVQGFDWSACGGTHVANSSQVGLVKVTGIERRGAELRVTFLCGRRARSDYARLAELAEGLVARFTTSRDELLAAVDKRTADTQGLRKELAELEDQWVEASAGALLAGAEVIGGWRYVVSSLPQPPERVRRLAQVLRSAGGVALFLAAVEGDSAGAGVVQLVAARSDGLELDAGAVMRAAVSAAGGKGGGRPDWAQGGAPAGEPLGAALRAARTEIEAAARRGQPQT